MLMADVMSIALSIVGFFLAMQGQWLVSTALWPNWTEASVQRHKGRLWWLFLAGIPATGVLVVLATLSNAVGGLGQAIALGLIGLWWMLAGVGLAAMATHIGRRLQSPADEHRPWRALVRGGVALQLAFLLPLIGWFGLLPIGLIIATGAATLALRDVRKASRATHGDAASANDSGQRPSAERLEIERSTTNPPASHRSPLDQPSVRIAASERVAGGSTPNDRPSAERPAGELRRESEVLS